LRINVSLNVTDNKTSNITVFLSFDNNSISAIAQASLITPFAIVSVDFDNETIKSTHYNGTYNIRTIKVDDKIISTDYTTAVYDYEAFAKTSYIKNISSYTIDNNSNNLTDILRFNVTINVKTANNYTLEGAIYDSDSNLIAYLSKNQSLSAGTQIVSLDLQGSTIYSTYQSGELQLANILLFAGNSTQDVLYSPYTTSHYSFFEFERPPLPDLTVNMTVLNNGSEKIINLTVQNIGFAPAFNVFLDLLDNSTYSTQESIAYLNINESQNFTFTINSTYNNSYFTAIVDLDNRVDESDESNNLASNYLPFSTDKQFDIKNSSGFTIAYVDIIGNFILKGNLTKNQIPNRSVDDLFVAIQNGSVVLTVRKDGNAYLKGNVSELTNISVNISSNTVKVKSNNTSFLFLLDDQGQLYLSGRLYENAIS
jgi:hypothetical protein